VEITNIVISWPGKRTTNEIKIAYISNSIFPPLLSAEEESYHIAACKKGNMESRNALIEHNLRLVAHICKKFESSGIDKDDLISIGTIGLIKAINSFSQDRGTRLATYAARCIENEILMQLRAGRNLKKELSLYEPVGVDKEGNEVVLLDILGSTGETVHEVIEQQEEKQMLLQNMDILDENERFVLRLRYGLDNCIQTTQREIAKKLGISRSYVSRIEKRAVQKLTAEMEKDK